MEWTVRNVERRYHSPWVDVDVAEVELPDGARLEHQIVRAADVAGVVLHDPERGVLALWRHRFITGEWAWELPGGLMNRGETAEEAAARELREETGYRAGSLELMGVSTPVSGLVDQRFFLFLGLDPTRVGEPTDPHEAERIEWVPVPAFRELVLGGGMLDGLSLTASLWALAAGRLGNDAAP